MTHLAVVAYFGLAVVVHIPLRMGGDQRARRLHMLAKHVDHHSRREQLGLRHGPAGDAANVGVELVHRAGLNSVMA